MACACGGMVDTLDLGSSAERRVSSSLIRRTASAGGCSSPGRMSAGFDFVAPDVKRMLQNLLFASEIRLYTGIFSNFAEIYKHILV